MIRDPSDGSVTMPGPKTGAKESFEEFKARYGENWGLTSLDKPERKPKPAPTKEELAAHYAKHNLGFQPKEEAE